MPKQTIIITTDEDVKMDDQIISMLYPVLQSGSLCTH